MSTRHDVQPFGVEHLDDAAALLSERHRRHRAALPALNPAYEQPAAARELVARLVGEDGAAGSIVYVEGAPAAYVLGVRKDATWGPNIWVVDAGSAGSDVNALRLAYAHSARAWAADGRSRHYVVTPATDDPIVDAWFRLGFGLQHVHALREPPTPDFAPSTGSGLSVRIAERGDVPALATLDLVLPSHSATSPTFAPVPVPTLEDTLAELESDFDDPRFTTIVAEHDGRVVGSTVACSLEVSNTNTHMMRPVSCGFLGYAAVLPEARGLGAGRALAEAVLAWARDEGYEWVATDWRSANLEADRTWRGAGFRPSFLRLYRRID